METEKVKEKYPFLLDQKPTQLATVIIDTTNKREISVEELLVEIANDLRIMKKKLIDG